MIPDTPPSTTFISLNLPHPPGSPLDAHHISHRVLICLACRHFRYPCITSSRQGKKKKRSIAASLPVVVHRAFVQSTAAYASQLHRLAVCRRLSSLLLQDTAKSPPKRSHISITVLIHGSILTATCHLLPLSQRQTDRRHITPGLLFLIWGSIQSPWRH